MAMPPTATATALLANALLGADSPTAKYLKGGLGPHDLSAMMPSRSEKPGYCRCCCLTTDTSWP